MAVDDSLTRISENKLLNVAGLQPLRKELLESALKYYQGFLEQRSDDLAVQKDLATAYTARGQDHRRDLLQGEGPGSLPAGPGDAQEAPRAGAHESRSAGGNGLPPPGHRPGGSNNGATSMPP